jgi:hypothetical protein
MLEDGEGASRSLHSFHAWWRSACACTGFLLPCRSAPSSPRRRPARVFGLAISSMHETAHWNGCDGGLFFHYGKCKQGHTSMKPLAIVSIAALVFSTAAHAQPATSPSGSKADKRPPAASQSTPPTSPSVGAQGGGSSGTGTTGSSAGNPGNTGSGTAGGAAGGAAGSGAGGSAGGGAGSGSR